MKQIYVCAVRLAIEADNEDFPVKALTALLTKQTKQYVPTSCLLDWEYDEYGSPQAQLVDYEFGLDSGVPQIFGRVVSA